MKPVIPNYSELRHLLNIFRRRHAMSTTFADVSNFIRKGKTLMNFSKLSYKTFQTLKLDTRSLRLMVEDRKRARSLKQQFLAGGKIF